MTRKNGLLFHGDATATRRRVAAGEGGTGRVGRGEGGGSAGTQGTWQERPTGPAPPSLGWGTGHLSMSRSGAYKCRETALWFLL